MCNYLLRMYVIELHAITKKLHTMRKNILLLILMVLMGNVTWANIVYTDITTDNNYLSGGSFDFNNDGTHFIYKDYAYEDIPNTLILAGDTGSSVGTYDIVMDSVLMDAIVIKGSIQVKGRIRNVGSNPIDTFDVVYTIDGGSSTALYTVIANQSITNNQTYDFTYNAPWNANSLGSHVVKIIVSNPIGSFKVKYDY